MVVIAGAVESVFHVSSVDATYLRLMYLLRMIRTVRVVPTLQDIASSLWSLSQAAKEHMESAPHDDKAVQVLATPCRWRY